jgi:chromosome segregation ATPase
VSIGSLDASYRPEFRKSTLTELLNLQLSLASQNNILLAQRALAEQEMSSLKHDIGAVSEKLISEGQLDEGNRAILVRNLNQLIHMKFVEKKSKLVQTSSTETHSSPSTDELLSQIKNYEERLAKAIHERDSTKATLDTELGAAHTLIQQKDEQIRTFQTVQTHERPENTLKAELGQYIKEISDLSSEVYRLKQENRSLRQQVDDKSLMVEGLQRQLEEVKRSLDSEIALKPFREAEIKQLTEALSRTKTELSEVRAKSQTLEQTGAGFTTPKKDVLVVLPKPADLQEEKKLAELMEELRQTKARLQEAEKELEKEKATSSRLVQESFRQSITSVRQSMGGAPIDRLKIELEYKNSKVAELEEDLEQAIKKSEKLKADLVANQLELDKKSTEAARLGKKLETIEKTHSEELTRLHSTIDKMSSDIGDQKKIIQMLNGKLDEYDNHMVKLEDKIQVYHNDLGQTKQTKEQIESKNKLLEDEIKDRDFQVEELKKQVSMVLLDMFKLDDKPEATSLSAMKKKFDEEMMDSMAENEDLRQKVKQKQQKINEMELELERVIQESQEKDRSRGDDDHIKKLLQEATKKLAAKQDEITELHAQIEVHSLTIERLHADLKYTAEEAEREMNQALMDAEDAQRKRVSQLLHDQSEELAEARQQVDLLKRELKEYQDPRFNPRVSLKDKQQEILDLTLQLNRVSTKAAQDIKTQDDEIQKLRAMLNIVGTMNEIKLPLTLTKEQETQVDHVNKVEDLHAAIKGLERQLSDAQNIIIEKDQQILDLELRLKVLKQGQESRSEVSEYDHSEYTDRINTLRQKIQTIQIENSQEIQKYLDELTKSRRSLTLLEDELDSERKRVSRLTTALDTASKEAETYRKYQFLHEKAIEEVQEKEQELQLANKRIKDLEAAISQTSSRLFSDSDTVTKLTSQIQIAAEQLAIAEKANRELKLKLEEKGLEVEQQARIHQRSLEAEKRESELLKDQLTSLKRLADEEREDFTERTNQLNKKLSDANRTISELEKQIKTAKREQSDASYKIETLERQLSAVNRQLADLQEENYASKNQYKTQNESLASIVDQQKEKFEAIEKEKASLERKFKAATTEIADLEAELEQLRKKSRTYESRDKDDALEQANSEIARLKKIVKHKETEIDELVNSLNQQAKKPSSSEAEQFEEIIRLKTKIRQLEDDLATANSKAQALNKADLKRYQEQVEELTEDKNQLLQKLKEKQAQMLKAIQEKDDELEQLQVNFQEKNSRLLLPSCLTKEAKGSSFERRTTDQGSLCSQGHHFRC